MRSETSTTKKTARSGANPPALTWTTEIAHSQHRWWWYLVIGWVGWTLAFMLVAVGNWTAALVAATATVGLLMINIGKPHPWKVTIDKSTVRIEGLDDEHRAQVRQLNRYRTFTVVDMPSGKHDEPQKAIALLPRARLRPPQMLVLPRDPHEADMLIQQFSDHLPFEDAQAYRATDRRLERFARWLGIS